MMQTNRRKWKWIGITIRKPSDSTTRMALEWNTQGSRSLGRTEEHLETVQPYMDGVA